MFPLNKLLLFGGGLAVAGTGTGLEVYYATNGGGEEVRKPKGQDSKIQAPLYSSPSEITAPGNLGKSDVT